MIKSFAKPNRSIDFIGLVVKTAHIKSKHHTQEIKMLQKYHTIDAVQNDYKLFSCFSDND